MRRTWNEKSEKHNFKNFRKIRSRVKLEVAVMVFQSILPYSRTGRTREQKRFLKDDKSEIMGSSAYEPNKQVPNNIFLGYGL